MANQFYWVGSAGPFQYDDAIEVAGDPDLDYDGANPPNQSGFICTGQLDVSSVPTLDPHVLRLVDVGVLVGDVIGPGASTDEAVVRWDTNTGKLVQDSNVLINDAGDITVVDDAWIGIGAALERIIFDAAGYISFMGCNIGIGTSTPGYKVVINEGTDRNLQFRQGIGDATAFRLSTVNDADSAPTPMELSASKFEFRNGNVGIGVDPLSILHLGMSTEDLEFVDAGSAAATEQDWIEVEVGGVQGYIHVFVAK